MTKVLRQKITSFMDPKLYAISVLAEHLSKSSQPLVPQQVFMGGGGGGSDASGAAGLGLMGTLVNLLVAEKSGFKMQTAQAGNGHTPPAEALARAEAEPGL